MAYFLVSVSTRENLDLCKKYRWAGFTNSVNGLWTFLDISEGDYVSFLYGARVHNLYRVVQKIAFRDAENLPPWPRVTFRSQYTYYFPFRLLLEQERAINEPMVRHEFAYVAENLLLRGGYRRTHFQADEVTLHQVSKMGKRRIAPHAALKEVLGTETVATFTPLITFNQQKVNNPYVFPFRELILQALLRKKLSTRKEMLQTLLKDVGIDDSAEAFEVLGEKALPEGFVDLVIKRRYPRGKDDVVFIEVKTGRASLKDIEQLERYLHIASDAEGKVRGVLIARNFPRRLPKNLSSILLARYTFNFSSENENGTFSYADLLERLEV